MANDNMRTIGQRTVDSYVSPHQGRIEQKAPVFALLFLSFILPIGNPASAQNPALGPDQGVPNSTGVLWVNASDASSWNREHLFLDEWRYAYRWEGLMEGIGVVPAAEVDELLDENGYPTSVPDEWGWIHSAIFSHDQGPATPLNGRYKFTYEGDGTIQIINAANQTSGPGWIEFDYDVANSANVFFRITETDGDGNHLRNFHVYKLEYEDEFLAGQRHHPLWAAAFPNVKVVRFMNTMNTNRGNDPVLWEERPTPEWSGPRNLTIPIEDIVALSNELGFDPWISLMHTADVEYTRKLAEYVRDNLDPRRKVYWEWSNEIWNWIFPVSHWIDGQRLADRQWDIGGIGTGSWMAYGGMLAKPHMDTIGEVFAGQMERVVRVANVQAAWPAMGIEFLDSPWYVNRLGGEAPYRSYEALAITGYFASYAVQEELIDRIEGGIYTEQENIEFLAAVCSAYIVSDLIPFFEQYRTIATERGLQMLMYEGGTHVVRGGETSNNAVLDAFYAMFNYTPEVAEVYRELITAWHDADPDGGFNQFVTVNAAGTSGSWGALRYYGDSNPRYDILMDYNNGAFP